MHKVKANLKKSIENRRMIYGVGINDADYVVQPIINGKKVRCHFYQTWSNMLLRCYSDRYHQKNTTYIGCSVCDEWLHFSNFKKWMENQDWQDKDLDKDIIVPGNKIYSPETCCFIQQSLNKMLTDRTALKGTWPVGVYKHRKKFSASCNYHGVREYLGSFATPEEASKAYQKRKKEIIYEAAMQQTDNRIRNGLLTRING